MGRRKNDHYDQESYSSDDDSYRERLRHELEDEAALFRDPHKRRRGMTKEQAIYGYDWDDDDDDSRTRKTKPSRARTDLSQFVTGSKSSSKQRANVDVDEDLDSSADEDGGRTKSDDDDDEMRDRSEGSRSLKSDEGDSDTYMSSDSEDEEDAEARREREEAFRAARERDRAENDAWEDRQMRSNRMTMRPGIGMMGGAQSVAELSAEAGDTKITTTTTTTTITSTTSNDTTAGQDGQETSNKSMADIFRKSLGLSATSSSPTSSTQRSRNNRANNSLSAFMSRNNIGSSSNEASPSASPRPSFASVSTKPKAEPETPVAKAVKVSKDFGAFSKQGSGIGLKLLKQMGWKEGYGLGAGGTGIVEPIQTKVRPTKMGLGFNGFREKTEQDRAEEKRRGYAVASSSDEEAEGGVAGKKKGGAKTADREAPKADGWKRKPGKGKKGPKIEYKTAEEIQREIEASDQPMAAALPQKILDMTGKNVRELTSASQISSLHMLDNERFPELRHNLDLMASISTTDLE
ncbi:hypothetical protein BGW41_006738, partial [Actinomortierella wolfii]